MSSRFTLETIKDQIIKALRAITEAKEINLEFPENEAFGDYSTNVAMVVFADPHRKLHVVKERAGKPSISDIKSPREFAELIVGILKKNSELSKVVEKIEIAGPGFINFWLKKDILIDNLMQIDSEKEKYGSSGLGKSRTVVIDYSSPNIAKPFGIGHLRSTIIGQALYNLYRFLGYEVIGDNHLGDWGTQFGVLLAQISKITNYKLQITSWTVEDLEKMYVKFHKEVEENPRLKEDARKWFKKLEDGNTEAKEIWQKCVDISMAEFERIYQLLGVKIDFTFGESYYGSEMKELLSSPSILKHVSEGEDGAKIIDLSKEGINIPLMLLKKDEGTTYATRDLTTIAFRVRKWNPDIIIYEVGAEQSFYFKQIFAAARLLGLVDEKVKLVHTAHGLYLAEDGKKFSTREGKTIKLDEVLNEACQRARKLQKEENGPAYADATARQVGIGAIKYFDLMHSVQSNIIFDWEKMMNLEGNSGPYLQYTVARTQSVLAKSTNLQISKSTNEFQINNEEMAILRKLNQFQEIIVSAAKNYSPNALCSYLYDLAQKFNGFYNKDRIIGSENENFRLALTMAVGSVLKTGLRLLGIETPERM